MLILRTLCFSATHFALWLGSAFVAYGSDLDQLPTRSAFAHGAALLCVVLQYPHDLILHLLPSQWLQQIPRLAIVVVLSNSLLWGAVLSVAWQLFVNRRLVNAPQSATPGISYP
jgi:hypothetical protein